MRADFFVPQTSIQEVFIVEGTDNFIFQQLEQNLIFIPIGVPDLDENELLQASLQNLFAAPEDSADVEQFLEQTGPQAIAPQAAAESASFITIDFADGINDFVDDLDDFVDDLIDDIDDLFEDDDDSDDESDDEEDDLEDDDGLVGDDDDDGDLENDGDDLEDGDDTILAIEADPTAEFLEDGSLVAAQLAFQETDILGNGNDVVQFSEQAIADILLFEGDEDDGSFEDFLERTAGDLLLDSLQFSLQDVIIEGSENLVDQTISQTIAAFVFFDEDEIFDEDELSQFAIQETFLGTGNSTVANNFVTQEISQSIEIDFTFSDDPAFAVSTTADGEVILPNFDVDTFIGTILGDDIVATGAQTSFQDAPITGNGNIAVQEGFQDLVQGTNADLVTGGSGDDTFLAAEDDFDGAGDVILTGAGADRVDFNSPALEVADTPSNALAFGGSGDDELIAAGSDLLFGGGDNDTLRSTDGFGNNRLYGGAGDDTFFLGTGDRAFGGTGNDRFVFGTGGGNAVAGSTGADEFWLADGVFPEEANTILDFDVDADILGILGLGVDFEDLTLQGNAIAIGDDTLAILLGVDTASLDESAFVFAV